MLNLYGQNIKVVGSRVYCHVDNLASWLRHNSWVSIFEMGDFEIRFIFPLKSVFQYFSIRTWFIELPLHLITSSSCSSIFIYFFCCPTLGHISVIRYYKHQVPLAVITLSSLSYHHYQEQSTHKRCQNDGWLSTVTFDASNVLGCVEMESRESHIKLSGARVIQNHSDQKLKSSFV